MSRDSEGTSATTTEKTESDVDDTLDTGNQATPSGEPAVGAAIPLEFPARNPEGLAPTVELSLMDQYDNGDGTITVQVLEWERNDDVVRVRYALPTGERQEDCYRWPTPGKYDDSDFIALIRELGYTPGSAEYVAGEFAQARNHRGRWRLVTGQDRGLDYDELPTQPDTSERTRETDQRRIAALLPAAMSERLTAADPMDLVLASALTLTAAVVVPATAAVTAPPGAITTALLGMAVTFAIGGITLLGAAFLSVSL